MVYDLSNDEKMKGQLKVTQWHQITADTIVWHTFGMTPWMANATFMVNAVRICMTHCISLRWACFQERRCAAILCNNRTGPVGSKFSGTLTKTRWTSWIVCQKSKPQALNFSIKEKVYKTKPLALEKLGVWVIMDTNILKAASGWCLIYIELWISKHIILFNKTQLQQVLLRQMYFVETDHTLKKLKQIVNA